MADIKISELVEAEPLDGTEDLPIVQDADTVRCSTQDIADLASVKVKKVSISSVQLLSANTSPITLLASPGPGKMIDVIRVYYKYTFVSAAYDTNTSLQVFAGAAGGQSWTSNTNFLAAANTAIVRPTMTAGAINVTPDNFEDLAVVLYASGGNPANGDGTVDAYIVYQILDI